MPVDSYKKAGVDIAAGDAFADFIRDLPSKAVSKAIGGFAGGVPLDLVAVDARDALDALGEITGEVATSEVLRAMFGSFCVGK